MRRDYEVFEKFSDGSTLWRTCVTGRFEAQRKMQEFKEHSENEFFILDIEAHDGRWKYWRHLWLRVWSGDGQSHHP